MCSFQGPLPLPHTPHACTAHLPLPHPPASLPAAGDCGWPEVGVRFFRGDLPGGESKQPSFEACCAACKKNKACGAISFEVGSGRCNQKYTEGWERITTQTSYLSAVVREQGEPSGGCLLLSACSCRASQSCGDGTEKVWCQPAGSFLRRAGLAPPPAHLPCLVTRHPCPLQRAAPTAPTPSPRSCSARAAPASSPRPCTSSRAPSRLARAPTGCVTSSGSPAGAPGASAGRTFAMPRCAGGVERGGDAGAAAACVCSTRSRKPRPAED